MGTEMNDKVLCWIKDKKWIMPLGFASLVAMCALAIVFCFIGGFSDLNAESVFNIGVDILSILVCGAIYYGCMSGRDRQGEATYLLTAMIRVTAGAQFLDVCVSLMDGVPSLWPAYRVVMAAYYAAAPILIYEFWWYVRIMLKMEGVWVERASLALRILLIPALVAAWINVLVPFYFTVDRQGMYQRWTFYQLNLVYMVFSTAVLLIAVLRSKGLNRQKNVVLVFIAMPLVSMLLDAAHLLSLSEFSLALLAIVLVYGVLYADQSNQLAATAAELDAAARIQLNMLPRTFPSAQSRGAFDLNALMDPAKEVGGDFYDFFFIDADHLALAVADVSGKGVPAALFMMTLRTMLKDAALEGLAPAAALEQVNERLSENNEDCMFVTVWLGILEISTGKLTYADAGHEKLLLYQNGAWRFLPKGHAPALAFAEPGELEDLPEEYRYHDETVWLKPGDILFQYTDGVTEATCAPNAGMNASETMFGEQRLMDAVSELGGTAPEKLLPHVRERIGAFTGSVEQIDDITMLALRYLGTDDWGESCE